MMFLSLMLATVTFTACKVTMYEMKTDGEMFNSLTKLTETPDVACPYGGDNDGPLYFAYQSGGRGQCNIYRKDKPLSSSMTQMTGVDAAMFPAYNKAVDKIAFRMNDDIYTMPASKGKAMTQITSTKDCREDHPCFSPDGRYIVYDCAKIVPGYGYYDTKNSEIWIKDTQSGENTLIGKGWSPSFSPDGMRIVYCKVDDYYSSSIWIMNSDGENQSKITDNNTIKSAQRPRFSPDGKYIVFDATDKENNMDLYVITEDGGNLTRLTVNKSNDSQPYWSTDGYIYFVSDRGGKEKEYNLWRFKY